MAPTAPPIDGSHWLTSPRIAWPDFGGRVVVAVFWTAGCEASIVRLRQVQALAEQFDDGTRPVVALAVHCPRFPYADDPAVAMDALVRNGLEVLCVHDERYISWNRYNPGGWPATTVIDQRGKVLGAQAGTLDFPVIASTVGDLVASGPRNPPPTKPLANPTLPVITGTSTTFPAGVSVSPLGRVAVADTGGGRVLVGRLESDLLTLRVEHIVDGFDQPTRLCWAGETVMYLIESGSNRVLCVDLGDGALWSESQDRASSATKAPTPSRRYLICDDLVAPSALCLDADGSLVVADAGAEQLFRLRFDATGAPECLPIAGSGSTGRVDGPGRQARLAQPAGLARSEDGLLFADSASGNLRLLDDKGRVSSITNAGFYDWGLLDGAAHRARLQRPTDLCVLNDRSVVVVDTGNSRLRRLSYRQVETLGLVGLRQPEAIARLGDLHVLVADTGNHRLLLADIGGNDAWEVGFDQFSSGSASEATSSSSASHSLGSSVGIKTNFEKPTSIKP